MRAVLLLLAACGGDNADKGPDQGFQSDTAVHITAPPNGATLQPTFTVVFESGSAVDGVRLDADDAPIDSLTQITEGGGSFAVTLADGRHTLRLVGLDADGAELSDHELTIRVEDAGDPWVTITSPQDGASVANPVAFAVDASDDIDRVELLADDWSLGSTEPGGVLSYEFEGTGTPRTIEARGWSGEDVVATDDIEITVLEGSSPDESAFNDTVLSIADGYPTDGTNGYYWPSDGGGWLGTTQDIWYEDTLVAEGDPEGRCYCVGITWEVFMRAWQQVDEDTAGDGTINGMDVDALTDFRVDWYVRDLYGSGVVQAVENYGIGDEVTDWADVRAGDFVQIWRQSGSGHSVIFRDWETDGDGDIIGLTYWSTQTSTDGIGWNTEYFGATDSSVDPSRTYFARVRMPQDWLPWR